jgi:hypothetical protein
MVNVVYSLLNQESGFYMLFMSRNVVITNTVYNGCCSGLSVAYPNLVTDC